MARLERVSSQLVLVLDHDEADDPWDAWQSVVLEPSSITAGMLTLWVEDVGGEVVNFDITPEDAISFGNWLITHGKQAQGRR